MYRYIVIFKDLVRHRFSNGTLVLARIKSVKLKCIEINCIKIKCIKIKCINMKYIFLVYGRGSKGSPGEGVRWPQHGAGLHQHHHQCCHLRGDRQVDCLWRCAGKFAHKNITLLHEFLASKFGFRPASNFSSFADSWQCKRKMLSESPRWKNTIQNL